MEPLSLAALAAKVAAAAAIVVAASRAAERAGPFLGAMVATLPVSTGPIYVFLAMDHGVAFVAEAAVTSVAGVAAIAAFVAGHALAAQRFATAGSLAIATLVWSAAALALQLRAWTFLEACLLFAGSLTAALLGLRRFALAAAPAAGTRTRLDLPLRALLVAALVVATTLAGNVFGPAVTGVLATCPVVFTSLIVILQPRGGGAFATAVLVNGLKGLAGFGAALAVLHVAALHLPAAPALLIALGVAVGWNLLLTMLRRSRAAALDAAPRAK